MLHSLKLMAFSHATPRAASNWSSFSELLSSQLGMLFDGARRIARRRPAHFSDFVLAAIKERDSDNNNNNNNSSNNADDDNTAASPSLIEAMVEAYRNLSPRSSRAVVELLARFTYIILHLLLFVSIYIFFLHKFVACVAFCCSRIVAIY